MWFYISGVSHELADVFPQDFQTLVLLVHGCILALLRKFWPPKLGLPLCFLIQRNQKRRGRLQNRRAQAIFHNKQKSDKYKQYKSSSNALKNPLLKSISWFPCVTINNERGIQVEGKLKKYIAASSRADSYKVDIIELTKGEYCFVDPWSLPWWSWVTLSDCKLLVKIISNHVFYVKMLKIFGEALYRIMCKIVHIYWGRFYKINGKLL